MTGVTTDLEIVLWQQFNEFQAYIHLTYIKLTSRAPLLASVPDYILTGQQNQSVLELVWLYAAIKMTWQ